MLKLDDTETPYAIDYDYCKGCGICAAECPCGAIEMVPRRSKALAKRGLSPSRQ